MSLLLSRWAALYTKPTVPEQTIEPYIAKLGRIYRAQHPVFSTGYILDFALLDEKIAIEVDGESHNGAKAIAHDRERTAKLQAQGWVVVRCTNEQALFEPAVTVERMLLEAADQRNALDLLKRNSPTRKKK